VRKGRLRGLLCSDVERERERDRERERERELESEDVNDSILCQLIYYYMKAREERKRQESEVESTRNYSMRAIPGTTNSWSFVLQVIKPFPIPASNACRIHCHSNYKLGHCQWSDRSTRVRACHRVFFSCSIHASGKRMDAFQYIAVAFVADALPSISCNAKSRARCRQGRAASAVAWEAACSRSAPAHAG
jgi:hypothetical protein